MCHGLFKKGCERLSLRFTVGACNALLPSAEVSPASQKETENLIGDELIKVKGGLEMKPNAEQQTLG